MGVALLPRVVPGLGIMEPAAREAIGPEPLVVLEVVDMYIGGRIVGGVGFALGGSIADNVYVDRDTHTQFGIDQHTVSLVSHSTFLIHGESFGFFQFYLSSLAN